MVVERGSQMLLKRQFSQLLQIRARVEQALVAMAQVQPHGFRLTKTRGEKDPLVALAQSLRLQLGQNRTRQPLAA